MIQVVKSDTEHYSIWGRLLRNPVKTDAKSHIAWLISFVLHDVWERTWPWNQTCFLRTTFLLKLTLHFHSIVMWMDELSSCFHLLINILHTATYLINSIFPRGNEHRACDFKNIFFKKWIDYHHFFSHGCFFYQGAGWSVEIPDVPFGPACSERSNLFLVRVQDISHLPSKCT